jgi:hypothetical protein
VQVQVPVAAVYVPAGHDEQATDPTLEYCPLPHLLEHEVVFAMVVLYRPQAQPEQTQVPVDDAYVPAGHSVHAVAPALA